MNRFTGIIMVEGEPTEDGRLVAEGALQVDTLPIPLMVLKEFISGHAGAERCGDIERVYRSGSRLMAEGVCSLEPGVYGCGVDLDGSLACEMIGEVLTFTAGRVRGVTAYADQATRPSHPECLLTVTA